jgi:hypothetical protein
MAVMTSVCATSGFFAFFAAILLISVENAAPLWRGRLGRLLGSLSCGHPKPMSPKLCGGSKYIDLVFPSRRAALVLALPFPIRRKSRLLDY